ncbi:hypothetical protein L4A40_26910 [Bacillus cereus]|uniref:hypothetical protein n=1 Tax=Bacillus cereus TaxID=1396 RepID=UPI001F0FA7EB|nr:hypothetical protein [Bacillus cereus]MCH5476718.1 hypothetical protein [Bacillus cereus]
MLEHSEEVQTAKHFYRERLFGRRQVDIYAEILRIKRMAQQTSWSVIDMIKGDSEVKQRTRSFLRGV